MLTFLSLRSQTTGRFIAYQQAHQLQLHYVTLRIQNQIPDTILFLEHSPVVTQGRGLQSTGKNLPLPLLPAGIEFLQNERGGDLTYHGPGQLVIYPICKLDGSGLGPERNITGFLRKLEQFLIDEFHVLQLPGQRHPEATGVWLKDQKVASLGITVRRWVTFHGMAINFVNSLEPFHLFSPCGLSGNVMTRLADWIPLKEDWREIWEQKLTQRMDPSGKNQIQVQWIESLL